MGSAPPIWRKPHFLYYWLPPILWGLAVICMSGDLGSATNTRHLLQWLLSGFVVLKPAQINLINFCFRKTGHVLAYGLMYFLWFRAFRGYADYGPWRACLWALGFCLLFSSADEGRQWFYASRGASVQRCAPGYVRRRPGGADCRRRLDARLQNPDHIRDGRRIHHRTGIILGRLP